MNRTEAAAMRAALYAVLQRSDTAMSTADLARLAPWHVQSVTSSCRSAHPHGQATSWKVLECHCSWHVIKRPRTAHDVHPHMQRLLRDRLVQRSRRPGDRKAYWSATAAGSDIAALDTITPAVMVVAGDLCEAAAS